jgi:cytochrome c-type biogenesis protein CcmH/NrfF
MYENRRMKPTEIVLRKGKGNEEELRYIVSTYGNIVMYPPVQLLYVNEI